MLLTIHVGAQKVSYIGTNNFLLNYFTQTTSSAYDWHYEPFKTDKERANLKGNVVRIISKITEASGRGFGENFTDTTYYDDKGFITKVVALKLDPLSFKPLHPEVWEYHYYSDHSLKNYAVTSEIESFGDRYWRSDVYTWSYEKQVRMMNEKHVAYKLNDKKQWEEIPGEKGSSWNYRYDNNGILVSGWDYASGSQLYYSKDHLVKMRVGEEKADYYSYDEYERLAESHFFVKNNNKRLYYEVATKLFYNKNGDISQAKRTFWVCNSLWERRHEDFLNKYDIEYIYDERDNWIKATVYMERKTTPRKSVITISRDISYDKITQNSSQKENTQESLNGPSMDVYKYINDLVQLKDLKKIREKLTIDGWDPTEPKDDFVGQYYLGKEFKATIPNSNNKITVHRSPKKKPTITISMKHIPLDMLEKEFEKMGFFYHEEKSKKYKTDSKSNREIYIFCNSQGYEIICNDMELSYVLIFSTN